MQAGDSDVGSISQQDPRLYHVELHQRTNQLRWYSLMDSLIGPFLMEDVRCGVLRGNGTFCVETADQLAGII
jgi:hypothetical protein